MWIKIYQEIYHDDVPQIFTEKENYSGENQKVQQQLGDHFQGYRENSDKIQIFRYT